MRLERLARDTGVLDRVRFLGFRPYERVPARTGGRELALLPLADGIVARCFTSPLKLFDYLAAGLPIVAVDFPTMREVLRDGENALLVPPERPGCMAAAVDRLLGDPALAARLARRPGTTRPSTPGSAARSASGRRGTLGARGRDQQAG